MSKRAKILWFMFHLMTFGAFLLWHVALHYLFKEKKT